MLGGEPRDHGRLAGGIAKAGVPMPLRQRAGVTRGRRPESSARERGPENTGPGRAPRWTLDRWPHEVSNRQRMRDCA